MFQLWITHIFSESFVTERNIPDKKKSKGWLTLDASCEPSAFHLVHRVGKMVANFRVLSLEVCVWFRNHSGVIIVVSSSRDAQKMTLSIFNPLSLDWMHAQGRPTHLSWVHKLGRVKDRKWTGVLMFFQVLSGCLTCSSVLACGSFTLRCTTA